MTRIGRPRRAKGKGAAVCVMLTEGARTQLSELVAWMQREIAGPDARVTASDVVRFSLDFLAENRDQIERKGA